MNKWLTGSLVGIGIAVIAYLDYSTGSEVRVFPLYFLPLMLAAWHLSRAATLVTALLITVAWAAMLYLTEHVYSEAWIWPVNVIAQAGMFLAVALLMSHLRSTVFREREYARTDPLTGLPNTRSFYERVGSVLAVCRRHSESATLAYLDLDNFKQVNDGLGHHKGDELLREVANVMNDTLRGSDIAARMGGDEFAILLAETDEAEARSALEKLRERIARSREFADNEVTVSIGAVSYDVAPADVTEMVHAADKVMYRVKAAGKNSVIVQNAAGNRGKQQDNVRSLRARG